MNIVDIKYYIKDYIKEDVEYYKGKYNRKCSIINLVYIDGNGSLIGCCNISCYNCDYYTSPIRRYLR